MNCKDMVEFWNEFRYDEYNVDFIEKLIFQTWWGWSWMVAGGDDDGNGYFLKKVFL